MEAPLVSVIVPIYNVEPYLEKCVRSVCAQTYTHMEIILVDDGSPDNCGHLCDQFAGSDPRIRVIHQENSGVSAARNAGLDRARGVYLYFVDSDDWVHESLVEETVELMERRGYDQCAWRMKLVDDQGEGSYTGRILPLTLRFSTPEQKQKVLCRWMLRGRLSWWTVCNRVFRREIVERNHLRFEDRQEVGAEDLDFTFRYLACCQNVHCTPKSYYLYYQREDSFLHAGTLQGDAVRMLRLVRREEELLSGQPLFRPFYPYAGTTLVTFVLSGFRDRPAQEGLAQMRAWLQATEDWPYLQRQAQLAEGDPEGIRRSCGRQLGGLVSGFYHYLLTGDAAAYLRAKQPQDRVDQLRAWKNKLLSLRP